MKTYSCKRGLSGTAYMVKDLISIRINSFLVSRYVLISNFQMEHNFRASTFKIYEQNLMFTSVFKTSMSSRNDHKCSKPILEGFLSLVLFLEVCVVSETQLDKEDERYPWDL